MKSVLSKEFAYQRKPFLICWQRCFDVILDFHNFSVRTPRNQNVRCVTVFGSVVVIFEMEWLFLPPTGAAGCKQYLKSFELILRFGMT